MIVVFSCANKMCTQPETPAMCGQGITPVNFTYAANCDLIIPSCQLYVMQFSNGTCSYTRDVTTLSCDLTTKQFMYMNTVVIKGINC